MDFTDGIFYNPESMDVKAGNPLKLHKLADLCGHAAGTYQGTVYVDMLKKIAAACRRTPSSTCTPTRPSRTPSRTSRPAGSTRRSSIRPCRPTPWCRRHRSASNSSRTTCREEKTSTLCAFGVAKGTNDKFVAAFNKHYAAMLADGTAAKLFEASGLTPTDFFLKP